MTKLIHPMTFIDKLVTKNELGQPFTLMDHQREILRLAFALKTAGCRGTRFFIPASRSREDDDVAQGDRAVFRLTMEHQKRKIDACVALSFAILGAIRNLGDRWTPTERA